MASQRNTQKRAKRFRPDGVVVGTLAMLVLITVIYVVVSRNNAEQQPQATPTPTPLQATPTPVELPSSSLPAPLANVAFPTQVVPYPPEWPADLRYPEQFGVVETSSGTMPSGGAKGRAAKLRHKGDATSAADAMSSFFTAKGWQVVQRSALDSGGMLLLVQKGDRQHSGIVVIDPEPGNADYVRILATVVP